MYSSNLVGAVNPYNCHIFLCYKSHESWPSRIEDSNASLLPKRLAAALKVHKTDINIKVSILLSLVKASYMLTSVLIFYFHFRVLLYVLTIYCYILYT